MTTSDELTVDLDVVAGRSDVEVGLVVGGGGVAGFSEDDETDLAGADVEGDGVGESLTVFEFAGA